MVTVGTETQTAPVGGGVVRASVGLSTADLDLIVMVTGVGPVGPAGPPSAVYTQPGPPDPGVLNPGDYWVQKPPELSPQPTFLWDGVGWTPIHGETSTLDDLTGVTVTDPVSGDVLVHNGTEFVNVDGTTVYQAADADLASIAALDSAANLMLYASAPGVWELTPITAVARELLSSGNVGAMRAYLSVWSRAEIGDPETDFVATFEAGLL